MGHISIVYGNIIGAPWKTADYHKLHKLNKLIIDKLPITDDDYPWITRSMFMVPNPGLDKIYRNQVITFGASYKSVEYEWGEWLEKFESILKTLYWTSATIHLETELAGDHKYEWLYDFKQTDNLFLDNPAPVTEWHFSGGPRFFFKNELK